MLVLMLMPRYLVYHHHHRKRLREEKEGGRVGEAPDQALIL